MTNITSKQVQRSLAIALLLAIILLVALIAVTPLINKGIEVHETKIDLFFNLQKFQRILARKNATIAGVEAIKEQHRQQGLLNSQSTAALASAEVQEFIKKIIVEAGGQLTSTQALPITAKNDFSRITVSVRMTGNSEVLRSVLHKLETSVPLVIINQIDIRPSRGVRNPKTHQIEPSNELSINFQAVSFMRKQPQ